MGKFKKDKGFALECERLYRSGLAIQRIANQLRCCYQTVRRALARQDVEVSTSGQYEGNPYFQAVQDGFDRGESYVAIARQLGVTRQRVHQIAKQLGLSHAKRSSERLAKLPPAQEPKAAQYARKRARIQELWAAGMPVRQIAETLGIPLGGCMHTITRIRRRAPDSLPNRIPTERGPDYQAKLARMHECWMAGESSASIAKKFGYLNKGSLSVTIHRAREQNPALFPRRQGGRPKRAPE